MLRGLSKNYGFKETLFFGAIKKRKKRKLKMTIKTIKEALKTSEHPVAKSLHHGTGFKVLILGFRSGMILKEHMAPMRAKLTVLEGAVIYKEENRTVELMQYDEVDIPTDVRHAVEAIQDSLCILSQGE